MLEQVLASASNAVDAYLASLFPVPFTEPAPAAVREAAQVFACELIYLRRGVGEKNPFGARADYWRDTLRKIGSGEIPLDAAREKAFAPGAAVTETEQLDGTTG
jgi:phage gp36-like protein